MVRIEVEHPLVMKWQHTTSIDVAETTTLQQVKEMLVKRFWEIAAGQNNMPKVNAHGSAGDVTLKNKEVTIETDAQLREHMKTTLRFQAIFKAPHAPAAPKSVVAAPAGAATAAAAASAAAMADPKSEK